MDFFRPKVDFNAFWPAKSIQRVNIYVSDEFEENRSKSHFPYHVTRSHRAKLAIFKTCSDLLNMGRVCSVLMPVVTLQSFKMIDRPEIQLDSLVPILDNFLTLVPSHGPRPN